MAMSQQPGGRRKPKKSTPKTKRPSAAVAPKVVPDASEAQAELADIGAVMGAAEDIGLTYKVSSTANADQEIRRFERWLDELCGLELDDVLRPGSRHGWQAIDDDVVVAYFAASARYGAITKGAFENNRQRLFRAFRMQRIEPPIGANPKIGGLATNLTLGDRRPTAAVYLGCGLEEISDAIEERHTDDPLWAAALTAYHLTAGFFGGRIGETLAHLRWGSVALDDSEMMLTWPAGLKYQFEAVTLKHVDDGEAVKYSPIEALRKLRKLSAKAGLPTGPTARIFPSRIGDGWTVTAEEDRIADTAWRPELTEDKDRRHAARAANAAQYRGAWTQAATSTEWAKHVGWRRIAPHGLRRGQATLMLVEGRSLFEIQLRLRHATPAITLRYTDGTKLELGEVTGLLDAEADPAAKHDLLDRLDNYTERIAELLAAGDAIDMDDEDDGPQTNLPVLDWAAGCVECGARQANIWAVKLEGEWAVLCGPHAKRLRILGEGDAWRDLGVRCEVDGCDTDIGRVGDAFHAKDADGQPMRVCNLHYQRYWNHLRQGDGTGDGWMTLVKGTKIEAETCEATGFAVDGTSITHCTNEPGHRWVLDDGTNLEVCDGHRQRFDAARSKGKKLEMVDGVITGQLGTPIRPRFKPDEGPACQVETSAGPCGRTRVGWIETATKGWVACCTGHKGWATRKGVRRTDPEGWPNADINARS